MAINIKHSLKKLIVRAGYNSSPSFLVVGAQKAGTTLLYSYLSQHPQILRPAFKEVHYFDRDENYKKGPSYYFKNFELPYRFNDKQITFEASPDYLFFPKCPGRIYNLIPDVKIIIILRDPIKRAYSAWNMHHFLFKEHSRHQWLHDPRSFEDAVDLELQQGFNDKDIFSYVYRGIYHEQIQRYFDVFGREKVLILDNQDLIHSSQCEFNKITRFLGIDNLNLKSILKDDSFWDNTGKYHKPISEDYNKKLKHFYYTHDNALSILLGKKFSWFS